MEKRVVLAVALTLLAVIMLGAYMAAEPQRQVAAAQRQLHEAVERGAPFFAGLCSGCHGQRGEGKVGPAVTGDSYLERRGIKKGDASGLRLVEIEMRKTIARGVPKTAMPAWAVEEGGSLNQEQILEIASFLLHGTGKDWERAVVLAAPQAETSQPAAAGGLDLAGKGRQVFESKGCGACHGPKGEGGAGPALTGFSEAQIVKQVRTPQGAMPAFPPDRVNDEELKSLVAFIESLGKK